MSGYTGNRRLSHEMALPPVIPSLTDKQPRNSPVSADRIPPERRGLLGAKKREKGGEGVFFAGIASYVVDGIDVGRWLPVCFCALLRHFSRCFGEGRAARAKARTGLAFVVSHPCLANSKYGQGHGKDGAPGGCDDFSEIFLHGCSLRTTTSIVRFWGLIARKVFPAHFGEISGLFCWV